LIKNFTLKVVVLFILIAAFSSTSYTFAQQNQPIPAKDTSKRQPQPAIAPARRNDSITVQQNLYPLGTRNSRMLQGVLEPDPPNLVRTITYDVATNRYILIEKVGNLYYRAPQYLTFTQYLDLIQQQNQRQYFQQLSDNYAYASQQPGFIPQMNIHNQTFEQIFGSSVIDIRPQGSAEMIFAGQVNSNNNPLYNTKQRSVFNFNFDQKIQMNVTGNIGDKLKITTNYNTDAQFQFDNQIKIDYTGHPDEIIQKIELGTVSMPLNTSLITGTQALFGLKTKL
jgi:cell surface protein SprA